MLIRDDHFPAEPPESKPRLRHLLLTRFNLRRFHQRMGIVDPASMRRWLDRRVPIFRDVCLASVLGQQRRPDVWLIGLDQTHPELVEDVLELIAPYEWIRPAWQPPGTSISDPFVTAIGELGAPAPWTVTTRLDNDDALSLDHLRVVRRYFNAVLPGVGEDVSDCWLSFPMGAQLHHGRTASLYVHPRAHFLTRASRRGVEGGTAYDGNHSKLHERGEPVFGPLTTTPMWLQHVHDTNALNTVNEDALRLDLDQVAPIFGLVRPAAD